MRMFRGVSMRVTVDMHNLKAARNSRQPARICGGVLRVRTAVKPHCFVS